MIAMQDPIAASALAGFVPPEPPAGADLPFTASTSARTSADGIAAFRRSENPATPAGLISQLAALVQQLLSALASGARMQQSAPQTYFSNANASSTGDPHLAFDGTDETGTAREAHFDSMKSHRDLLDSSSFAGGYRIATTTTAPDARGITYNRAATIFTGFGSTQITLDNAGNASVTENGQTRSLSPNQSLDLTDGERVTRDADGALEVVDRNGLGGEIAAKLSENGAGVDVRVQSRNVDLGGDLVRATASAR